MENQSRLMELLSNTPTEEPKIFKGTLGENFLNITPQDRQIFRQKMENGLYGLEPEKNEPVPDPTLKPRQGFLQKNVQDKPVDVEYDSIAPQDPKNQILF